MHSSARCIPKLERPSCRYITGKKLKQRPCFHDSRSKSFPHTTTVSYQVVPSYKSIKRTCNNLLQQNLAIVSASRSSRNKSIQFQASVVISFSFPKHIVVQNNKHNAGMITALTFELGVLPTPVIGRNAVQVETNGINAARQIEAGCPSV